MARKRSLKWLHLLGRGGTLIILGDFYLAVVLKTDSCGLQHRLDLL